MIRPPAVPAERVVLTWEPAFRAGMAISPAQADDPVALAAAARALPDEARDLLFTLLLALGAGSDVPERFRAPVEREGAPLWRMAALLPKAVPSEGHVSPLHYASACRLNPALAGLVLHPPVPAVDAQATWPPSDARWDAVVLAALFEAQPAQLTVDGALRRDVERRLWLRLGGDEARWRLALRLARETGLARPSGDRLLGMPEAAPRPVPDPSVLVGEPLRASAAAALWRRLPADGAWVDLSGEIALLRAHARDLCLSPVADLRGASYPSLHGLAVRPWDDAGWEATEAAWLRAAADTFHRAGLVEAARDASGAITALRRTPAEAASHRPGAVGFMLLPDNEILVHPAELPVEVWGRLARMAPWVEGQGVLRHRLTRDGVAADLSMGHLDPLGFLAVHSRTGVPTGVAETVRDWERSATRVVVHTGVDLLEDPQGGLRRPAPGEAVGARVIDYAEPPRARFVYVPSHEGYGALHVPVGADALTIRATLARLARPDGRDPMGEWVYRLEPRVHADPDGLLARLVTGYGGTVPGEVEALVRAGTRGAAARVVPAVMVRLPDAMADALRRDHVAGPLLRRAVSATESVVDATDLPTLRERLGALGVGWDDTDHG